MQQSQYKMVGQGLKSSGQLGRQHEMAKEKLTLIDAENNTEYEIIVSKEEGQRALQDMAFAQSLLMQAQKRAVKTTRPPTRPQQTIDLTEIIGTTEKDYEDVTNNPGCSQSNENQSSNENNDNSKSYWNRAETLLLIASYKEIEKDFTSGKMTQKQCWNKVAQIMQKNNINVSGQKCCTRYQTLKRTYRTVHDHNHKSGNARKTWEYYDVMDEMCRTKPWVEPLAVAGSNVETLSEDEKENETQKTNTKRKINQIFEEYANNCLGEKRLKREAAEKRHEEKMQILRQMENLLGKMVNNQKD